MAGDDGGHRRPRRKGAARSAACGAPRLAFVDGDEEADDGGAARQVGEARRGWLPRLRRRTATEALGMMGGSTERREGEWMREAQGPRVSGVSGRETRGGAGAGALIPPGVGAGEVVGRQRAPVPTRSGGTGRGRGGELGWAGVGARVAAQFGPGFGPDGPRVQWGGKGLFLFLFFSFCDLFYVFLLFVYFLFCFISFKSN